VAAAPSCRGQDIHQYDPVSDGAGIKFQAWNCNPKTVLHNSQGFQIKPVAGGISVYSGHLSLGFKKKKKKKFFFFFFGENDPPDSFSPL
jgi:hypothetical protein